MIPAVQLSKYSCGLTENLADQFNRPLKKLRISVTDRCNFRCPYCMPEKEGALMPSFLDEKERLSFEEILRLTNLLVHVGVSRIRITGGEPLLRPELSGFIQELSQIPGVEDLALTTNGTRLKRKARELKQAGLHRLTVSLDSLDNDIFQTMNGHRGAIRPVLEGIREAERAGFDAIKINVVVQKDMNDHTLLDLVDYFVVNSLPELALPAL